MATNLTWEITKIFGPTILARTATGLGLDKPSVEMATNAAVPALLAALVSLVSKPQGPARLSEAVAKQHPDLLSNLASVVGGSGRRDLIDQGDNALNSLLGGKTVSSLTSAVGQYAGIGEVGSKSLMGLLGPVVLGVLGQQQRSSGLDSSGLARLLTSQKDAIFAALPSGFSRFLSGTGILDSVTGSVGSAYQTPSRSTPSAWPWALAAAALLLLGGLGWSVWSGHRSEGPKMAVETPSPAETLQAVHGVRVGDVDLGQLAKSAIDGLQSSLRGIKDEATAQTAMPGLTQAASQFDQLTGLLGQLSPATRKTLPDAFVAIRPQIDKLFDQAMALPGVGPVIKPTVDVLRSKLDTLATA
jgi:uncharacterized protein DUF937